MELVKPSNEQLALYKSLFTVREDVFAIRWEKGNKKGYFPAYHFDPYMYKLHKMKGGTFSNYSDRSHLQLDDSQLVKHFLGEQHIGGYPLLAVSHCSAFKDYMPSSTLGGSPPCTRFRLRM